MKELGVQMIAAYSPQARGRSERSFGTWQGRLPQELRLAGITTVEGANAFLREGYIAEFNDKFSVPAAEKGTAFRRTGRADLNWIFSVQTERVVDKDNTVAIRERLWQIDKTRFRNTLAGSTVTIHEHLDETVSIRYGPHVVGRYSRTGEKLTDAKPKERRGKGGSMEAGENQKQVSPRSHTPLEISPKPRDSHLSLIHICAYNTDLQRDPHVRALKESDAYPAMAERGYGWEKLVSAMAGYASDSLSARTCGSRCRSVL